MAEPEFHLVILVVTMSPQGLLKELWEYLVTVIIPAMCQNVTKILVSLVDESKKFHLIKLIDGTVLTENNVSDLIKVLKDTLATKEYSGIKGVGMHGLCVVKVIPGSHFCNTSHENLIEKSINKNSCHDLFHGERDNNTLMKNNLNDNEKRRPKVSNFDSIYNTTNRNAGTENLSRCVEKACDLCHSVINDGYRLSGQQDKEEHAASNNKSRPETKIKMDNNRTHFVSLCKRFSSSQPSEECEKNVHTMPESHCSSLQKSFCLLEKKKTLSNPTEKSWSLNFRNKVPEMPTIWDLYRQLWVHEFSTMPNPPCVSDWNMFGVKYKQTVEEEAGTDYQSPKWTSINDNRQGHLYGNRLGHHDFCPSKLNTEFSLGQRLHRRATPHNFCKCVTQGGKSFDKLSEILNETLSRKISNSLDDNYVPSTMSCPVRRNGQVPSTESETTFVHGEQPKKDVPSPCKANTDVLDKAQGEEVEPQAVSDCPETHLNDIRGSGDSGKTCNPSVVHKSDHKHSESLKLYISVKDAFTIIKDSKFEQSLLPEEVHEDICQRISLSKIKSHLYMKKTELNRQYSGSNVDLEHSKEPLKSLLRFVDDWPSYDCDWPSYDCVRPGKVNKPLGSNSHQTLMIYPVHRGGWSSVLFPQDFELIRLMNYEVFRLGSFSHSIFSRDSDVFVVQLARSGFFFSRANRKVRCFSCNRVFPYEHQDSTLSFEAAHDPNCGREQQNRPLESWLEGLSQQYLTAYYQWYGTLMPNDLEHAQVQSADGLSGESSSGYGSLFHSAEQGEDLADTGGSSSSVSHRKDHCHHTPSATPAVDGAHMIHSHSLPGKLSDIAGNAVRQESLSMLGQLQVLTSAARSPVLMERQAGRITGMVNRDSRADQGGAVGGQPQAGYDLMRAAYPQFASAKVRRATFVQWNSRHTHRPEDLISAGFFYAGYQDCVRCFYCALGLKYWRASDIPAYQHARFRPECVYILMVKGQDYVDRVQQDVNAEEVLTTSEDTSPLPAAATFARDDRRHQREDIQTEEPPELATPMVQTLLDAGWTRDAIRQGIDYVVREFGEENLLLELIEDVLSNLNLERVEQLPPAAESRTRSVDGNDQRDHISITSGDDFDIIPAPLDSLEGNILSDASLEGATADPVVEAPKTVLVQQPAIPELRPEEQYLLARTENKYLTERMTCLVCTNRLVSCVYLPCGHVIACNECADIASTCKLCKAVILGTADIYLA